MDKEYVLDAEKAIKQGSLKEVYTPKKVGDYFRSKDNNHIFVLSSVGFSKVLLVNIKNGQGAALAIADVYSFDQLSEEEWNRACGGSPEEFIPITLVTINSFDK